MLLDVGCLSHSNRWRIQYIGGLSVSRQEADPGPQWPRLVRWSFKIHDWRIWEQGVPARKFIKTREFGPSDEEGSSERISFPLLWMDEGLTHQLMHININVISVFIFSGLICVTFLQQVRLNAPPRFQAVVSALGKMLSLNRKGPSLQKRLMTINFKKHALCVRGGLPVTISRGQWSKFQTIKIAINITQELSTETIHYAFVKARKDSQFSKN